MVPPTPLFALGGIAGEGATDGRPESEHAGEESGRQSHASRPGSKLGRSRPESRLGSRPGSSLRQSGQGWERSKKGLAVTSEEEVSVGVW